MSGIKKKPNKAKLRMEKKAKAQKNTESTETGEKSTEGRVVFTWAGGGFG